MIMEDATLKVTLVSLLHNIEEIPRRAKDNDNPWIVDNYLPKHLLPILNGALDADKTTINVDEIVKQANSLVAGGNIKQTSIGLRLRSIFSSVDGLQDENKKPIKAPVSKYIPLKKLEMREDTIFAIPKTDSDSPESDYNILWKGFCKEMRHLKQVHEKPPTDNRLYLNHLLKLLQRYFWCVPASYYGLEADVSFYDHNRMVAAVATCLLKQQTENDTVALLVGGDISGVQNFIYTITSQGATSGLRGRSMYLQLLTEVVARYLLNQLNVPLSNLIYAGGGHFYLLAPPDKIPILKEAQKYISRILLHHHQGDLYLALAWECLKKDDFAGDVLNDSWGMLQKKLQQAKQHQFKELGQDIFPLLFKPKEHGGNEDKQCAVCQREHPQTYVWKKDEPPKCPLCYGFEFLGRDLRKASYLYLDALRKVKPCPKPNRAPRTWRTILGQFGYRVNFDRLYKEKYNRSLKSDVARRNMLALNDNALANSYLSSRVAGRHFLVNVTPTIYKNEYEALEETHKAELTGPNTVKTLDILAIQSIGIKRLGILRMDVDNLGQIFSRGLGKKSTLSRKAALSFTFSLFFEGWLEIIAHKVNETARFKSTNSPQPELIYSIYSGGDDLFFVGAWDLMPDLAERIKQDLVTYGTEHPGVHVSGGIILIPPKSPLYLAAEEAGEAEEMAKSTERTNGARKNALVFLNQCIPWEQFEYVKEKQTMLNELVNPGGEQQSVPKSILYRLNRLHVQYIEQKKKLAEQGKPHKAYWGPAQWQAAYSLTRMARQQKESKNCERILEIRDDLGLTNFRNIEWIGLAARWTELLNR